MFKCHFLLVLVFFWAIASGDSFQVGRPHTTVQTLTQANFQTAIQDPANGLWLLKFYAPWCGHCKRMAPVLDEVAAETVGRLAIGKIDCDREKQLCKEFNVKGYPTLFFSRDGDVQEFPFSRSKDDIIKFASMMNAPAVKVCDTMDDALQLASTTDNGIVFVCFHPQVSGETLEAKLQSTHLSQVVAQSARIHQAFSTFCLLSPTADLNKFGIIKEAPDGFVAKVESGGVPPVLLKGSNDLSSTQVLDFVKEKNVPLVAHLGPHNFNKISVNGKPIVIGAVDGSNDGQVKEMKKNLLDYALTGPKAIVDKYYFGWIDGKQWHRFLSQFNITSEELPQVFVLDAPSKTYWHDSSILVLDEFLAAVEDGRVEKRGAGSASSSGFLSGILSTFADAYFAFFPWSVAVIVAFVVLLVLVLLPAPQELRPPYPQQPQQQPARNEAPAAADTPTDDTADEGETKKDK